MRYENRQPSEGINVTRVNPYTQFLKLFLAATLFLILLVLVLQFFGGAIAKRVPFTYEKQLSETLNIDLGSAGASPEMVQYLNELASRVAPGMQLTESVSVDVFYNSDEVFNAFATIGGNLVFYRGLLNELPHENALAMVMAHEMAHINHRDPITSAGGGVASLIAVSFVTGFSGVAEKYLSATSMLTNTQFTRHMESAADKAALEGVNALYGHVNGASALFEVLGAVGGDNDLVPNWLERFTTTHPLSNDRINAIRNLAIENGWSETGELTPLPADFKRWLNDAS